MHEIEMDTNQMMVSRGGSILSTIFFLLVVVGLLYIAYTYLFPSTDAAYVRFLAGDSPAMKPVTLLQRKTPPIYTGGDFTFSFWMYVDNWNYRANKHKFLFSIGPENYVKGSKASLVGVLTPQLNSMMVRARTVATTAPPAPGSAPDDTYGPDITDMDTLKVMMDGNAFGASESGIGAPCDIKEVPLQRWVNITIVSSGRVLDIYMNGKLSRSCVLKNVLEVPRGPMTLNLGEHGGFGGHYSTAQMWNQQLTPDVIYTIYQVGPTQDSRNFLSDLASYLNLNVRFTSSSSNEPKDSLRTMAELADQYTPSYIRG